MKLYYVQGSPNCRKVHAVINHLGLQVDFEYLDLFAGDLATPEFGRINPNRMVPVLIDDDFVLWESNAIIQYLADQVPGNSLYPTAPKPRAEINRWLSWELAHYNQALGLLAFETVLKSNLLQQETNQSLADWCKERLNRYAPVLEAALQGRNYLVGDAPTLADYAVAHIEIFVEAVPFDWAPYPNIRAYYQRMGSNPHWGSTAVPPEELGRRPRE
jgi:glutathione S-transferase